LGKDGFICSEKMDEKEFLIKSLKADKMLHIGIYIYSLSKIYMYNNAYSIIGD